MYRVRKSWADTASQIGAYDLLQNAIIAVHEHPGYFIYDESGHVQPHTMFFWGKLKKKAGSYKKGQSVRVFRNAKRQWVLREVEGPVALDKGIGEGGGALKHVIYGLLEDAAYRLGPHTHEYARSCSPRNKR
jgi:hypothetical protein